MKNMVLKVIFGSIIFILFSVMSGCSNDYAKVKKMAEGGDPAAQLSLSYAYALGSKWVGRDRAQAVTWAKKSAQNGYPQGQYTVAEFLIEDVDLCANYTEGIEWHKKCANNGNGLWQNRSKMALALIYTKGNKCVPINYSHSSYWVSRAAVMGDHDAIASSAAWLLKEPSSIEVESTAKGMLQESSNAGHLPSQFRLGLLLISPKFIQPSPNEGREFIVKAAKGGYKRAELWLAQDEATKEK